MEGCAVICWWEASDIEARIKDVSPRVSPGPTDHSAGVAARMPLQSLADPFVP